MANVICVEQCWTPLPTNLLSSLTMADIGVSVRVQSNLRQFSFEVISLKKEADKDEEKVLSIIMFWWYQYFFILFFVRVSLYFFFAYFFHWINYQYTVVFVVAVVVFSSFSFYLRHAQICEHYVHGGKQFVNQYIHVERNLKRIGNQRAMVFCVIFSLL